MNTPTLDPTTTDRAEIQAAAVRINEHRELRGWSLSELLRRHGGSEGLGSDKTFNKLLNGDTNELNVPKHLINYRAVLCLLDETPLDEADEEVFEELSGPKKARKALLKAMTSQTPARLVIIEGASGMGKTSILKVVRRLYGARVFTVEATAAWNDSPNAMLLAIADALNDTGIETSRGQFARLKRVVYKLNEQRRCLAIEEAHHLGPKCLNVLKTLINQTKSEVVLLAIPTLLRRLEHAAYEEALQLTRNRLCERVRLTTLNLNDIKILLTRRLPAPGLNGSLDRAAELLAQHAPRHGNLALVREVIRRVNAAIRDDKTTKLDLPLIEQAVAAEIAVR
jgi:type II secretory pathway predicted ATPase ExeA